LVSRHECRFVSRLPAGEVGVARQVVDQLADHETVVELGRYGDVTSAALSRVGPGQRETVIEFAINPALLREAFAADLPEQQTATQRPVAAAAFSDTSGPAAWRGLPSWAVVATGDKAAGADLVRSMAQRAGADTVEVEGSHAIMISQPQAVTDLIVKAAGAAVDPHR
jgi:hypothetical protein